MNFSFFKKFKCEIQRMVFLTTPAFQFSDTGSPVLNRGFHWKIILYPWHSIQAIPRVNSLSLSAQKWRLSDIPNWGHKYVFPRRNSNQARTTHRLWKDLCRARVYQCKIFSGQIWSCMEIFTAKKEWARKETGLHTSRNSPTNPEIKQPEVMSIKARSTVVLSPSATQLSYFYLSSRKQYILIVNNTN